MLTLAAASSDGRISVHTHRRERSQRGRESVSQREWKGLPVSCDGATLPPILPSTASDDGWTVALCGDCPGGVNAISFAPARHVGAGAGEVLRLAAAGCDGRVLIYASRVEVGAAAGRGGGDAAPAAGEWALESALEGGHGGDWVRDVAWAPGGLGGLGGANLVASAGENGSVVLWRQTTAGGEWSPEALPPFPSPVWRVSWSGTGNLLAVSCGDNSVTLWKEGAPGGGHWQQVSAVPDPVAAVGPAGAPAPAPAPAPTPATAAPQYHPASGGVAAGQPTAGHYAPAAHHAAQAAAQQQQQQQQYYGRAY